MPDMQLRHKLRKVMDEAKSGEQIPERPKKIGFIIFCIFASIWIIGFAALAVSLAVYGYPISALITFIIAGLLIYTTYKLITAKNLDIR